MGLRARAELGAVFVRVRAQDSRVVEERVALARTIFGLRRRAQFGAAQRGTLFVPDRGLGIVGGGVAVGLRRSAEIGAALLRDRYVGPRSSTQFGGLSDQ